MNKSFNLGIDAGGTYTDVVLIDESGNIVDSNKTLTSYPDPLFGIKDGLNKIDQNYFDKVVAVSISTTLSTNTILENTGYPVGLIIVGKYKLPDHIPIPYYCIIDGGHDINGDEICSLDLQSVIEFCHRVKNNVSAFAVSSLFGTRNSSHELKIKSKIMELFSFPVVCGHELSQNLGAYERAITAYLNAQLIPITKMFIDSIKYEIKQRKINAVLLMMKCDGSVVDIDEALNRPIETIFSGPAASLIGASYLSKLKSSIVVDIGGTSTDIAKIKNNIPELNQKGAKVGGWSTRVNAINMETIPLGGDSHIYLATSDKYNFTIYISSIRVIPLCVASSLFHNFSTKLKSTKKPPRKYINEFILPTTFYIRISSKIEGLNSIEKKHLFSISITEPTSWENLKNKLGSIPFPNVLKSLLQKRLIQMIGFTPTDASHVLKESFQWDSEAAFIGAQSLSFIINKKEEEIAKKVKEIVSKKISLNIIRYLLQEEDNKLNNLLINKAISIDNDIKYKLFIPIVLIGGPSEIYKSEIEKYLVADIVNPPYSKIANAVGAVVGKRVKKIEILITNFIKKQDNKVNVEYFVFYNGVRSKFSNYKIAYEYACSLGSTEIKNYFRILNIDDVVIQSRKEEKKYSFVEDNITSKIETVVYFSGVGNSKY